MSNTHDRLEKLTTDMFDARTYDERVVARDRLLELADELRPHQRRVNWAEVRKAAVIFAAISGIAILAATVLVAALEYAATVGPAAGVALGAISTGWTFLSAIAVMWLIVNGFDRD